MLFVGIFVEYSDLITSFNLYPYHFFLFSIV